MEYGTGAIMAVPEHDQRDLEFCRKYGLPVRVVVQPKEVGSSKVKVETDKKRPEAVHSGQEAVEEAFTEDGVSVNAGPYSGMESETAIAKMAAFAEQKGFGRAETIFRLKDWGISRQRYWGTPIPVVYCEKDGLVPVPEDQLPVHLPEHVEFKSTGESPLRYEPDFVNTTCPACGGPATREADTMDTFICSSWYFLRYADAHNDQQAWSQEAMRRWLPVDL